jgi:hypothetical protein
MVTYSDLQVSFSKLTHETRVSAALLFQVFAQALLFHSPHDQIIGSLITIPSMTFQDLAIEHSEIGAGIVVHLDNKDVSLRPFKHHYSAPLSIKQWETCRSLTYSRSDNPRCSRDWLAYRAHGIRPIFRSGADQRQNPRYVGYKVWVVLHIWDLHMTVVLGRSIKTDSQIDRFAPSMENEEIPRGLYLHWQTETGYPRPSGIIPGYDIACRYFKDNQHI